MLEALFESVRDGDSVMLRQLLQENGQETLMHLLYLRHTIIDSNAYLSS